MMMLMVMMGIRDCAASDLDISFSLHVVPGAFCGTQKT